MILYTSLNEQRSSGVSAIRLGGVDLLAEIETPDLAAPVWYGVKIPVVRCVGRKDVLLNSPRATRSQRVYGDKRVIAPTHQVGVR